MYVTTFPGCCGAGVLVIEHLTGKGKEADFNEIKKWIAYGKRNGLAMYDRPESFGGKSRNGTDLPHPYTGRVEIGGKGDEGNGSGWGMLLAITAPRNVEAAKRLEEFGFTKMFETHNPVYSSMKHTIVLWGLDIARLGPKDLKLSTVDAEVAAKPTEKLVTAK